MNTERINPSTMQRFKLAPLGIKNWDTLGVRAPDPILAATYVENMNRLLPLLGDPLSNQDSSNFSYALSPDHFMFILLHAVGVDSDSYDGDFYPRKAMQQAFQIFTKLRDIEKHKETSDALAKFRKKSTTVFATLVTSSMWPKLLHTFPIDSHTMNRTTLASSASGALLLSEYLDDISQLRIDVENANPKSLYVRILREENELDDFQELASKNKPLSIAALIKSGFETPHKLRGYFHSQFSGLAKAPRSMRDYFTYQFYNLTPA